MKSQIWQSSTSAHASCVPNMKMTRKRAHSSSPAHAVKSQNKDRMVLEGPAWDLERLRDWTWSRVRVQLLWGGRVPVLMRWKPPPSRWGLLLLSCGADVQLTLQDVVDDRLAQVVHDVAVAVLQGQPGEPTADGKKSICSSFISENLLLIVHRPISLHWSCSMSQNRTTVKWAWSRWWPLKLLSHRYHESQ